MHGRWPCRTSSSQGLTERQEELWAQDTAPVCLPHPSTTFQFPSTWGPQGPPSSRHGLHILATTATGQEACAVVRVPSESVPDAGGWVPSRLPCAAQQAKFRFSGSKTLGSNPFQQFQQLMVFPQACPSR